MLDESNLIPLKEEQLSELNISDSLPTQQRLLYEVIISFSLQKEKKDFLFFYREKINDFEENDDVLLNKIRVNKSRLNTSLKEFDLYIDKSFKIYKINTMSLEFLKNEASKIMKNHIKHIKIYDAYTGIEKDNFLSEEVKNILKSMIKNDNELNNKNVEIISILNNSHTKDFYKELLEYQNNLNKNTIKIKYIRNTFVQSSSLFYVLITDIENNNFIIYWEKITKWSVVSKVEKETTFSQKFFKLLEERFDYYFLDINGELHLENEVIDISVNSFKNNFLEETTKLIKELEKSIFIKNDYEMIFHNLVKNIKELKISFPEEEDTIKILLHFVKLAEISHKLENTTKTTNIADLMTQIINSQIHLKIYRKLHNEIKNDSCLISKININRISINELRYLLNTKKISSIDTKEFFIIDLFPNYRWNTHEQICDSLNLIIERSIDTKLLIKLFIKNENIFSTNKRIEKIILRIIFDVLYNIPYEEKINKFDKDFITKISFSIYNSELKDKINKLIE